MVLDVYAFGQWCGISTYMVPVESVDGRVGRLFVSKMIDACDNITYKLEGDSAIVFRDMFESHIGFIVLAVVESFVSYGSLCIPIEVG